jgi:hypothetical protein
VGRREETRTKKLRAMVRTPDGRVATAKLDLDAMNTVGVDDRKIPHDVTGNAASSTAVTQIQLDAKGFEGNILEEQSRPVLQSRGIQWGENIPEQETYQHSVKREMWVHSHTTFSTKQLRTKAIFALVQALRSASKPNALFATSAAVVPGHFVQVVSAEMGGPLKGAIRVVSGFGAGAGVVLSRIVVFVVVGVVSS